MTPALCLSARTFRIKLNFRFLLLKHQKDSGNGRARVREANVERERTELDKNILFEHEIIWLFIHGSRFKNRKDRQKDE